MIIGYRVFVGKGEDGKPLAPCLMLWYLDLWTITLAPEGKNPPPGLHPLVSLPPERPYPRPPDKTR